MAVYVVLTVLITSSTLEVAGEYLISPDYYRHVPFGMPETGPYVDGSWFGYAHRYRSLSSRSSVPDFLPIPPDRVQVKPAADHATLIELKKKVASKIANQTSQLRIIEKFRVDTLTNIGKLASQITGWCRS